MKTLCSLSFLLSTIYAQDVTEKKFWAGPTVGLNLTGWVGGKVVDHSSYETTYNFGAKLKYGLTDRLSLNGYVLYSGRSIDVDENHVIDERSKYLDIPLTVSYEFGNGNIKFYPMLGLHNAFLLKGKLTVADPSYQYSTVTYNFFDNTIGTITAFRYHIGYTVGIGNEFHLTPKLRMFLEARYTRSLVSSWAANNGTNTDWLDNIKVGVGDQEFFSLNVGVLF